MSKRTETAVTPSTESVEPVVAAHVSLQTVVDRANEGLAIDASDNVVETAASAIASDKENTLSALESELLSGDTSGVSVGSSAGVSAVRAALERAGTKGKGLTAGEVRAALAFNGTSKALRARIRDAQSVAARAGNLVFTDNATSAVVDGKQVALPRATKRYFVVQKSGADSLSVNALDSIYNRAVDYRYKGRIKGRLSLTE